MLILILALSMMMLLGGIISAKELTVIASSDIHGAIYPCSYKIGETDDIGIARIAAMVKEAEAENPNLLLIDAGDIIQGNTLTALFKDRRDVVHPMMKVMNEMGYDAMTLGNHEFNFGLETMDQILADAKFPILSANTIVRESGNPLVKPYTIKEIDGVKIAILGLTTTNIPIWDGDKVDSLEFKDMDKAAAEYIPELKEKADLIVALVHAGLEGRHDPTGGDSARKIAENNPEILAAAEAYHNEVVEYLNTPIGYATGDFTPQDEVKGIPTAQIQNTAVLDLINRVQMEKTGADISSAALFVADSTIDQGPVSIKDAARIYKYSNTLYAVEISGKELKDYLESTAAYYNTYQPGDITVSFNSEIRGYRYDMFQEIDYKIDISEPVGKRIKDLEYQGKAVRDEQTFKLALNNYRYSGLHSDGIISNDPYYKSEAAIREMIIEYIDQKEKVDPVVDHNWKLVGADLDHPHREEALALINNDILKVPSINRSWNAASINLEAELTKALIRMFNYDIPAEVEEATFKNLAGQDLAYAEAAKLMGAIDHYRQANLKDTILVDGGDAYQGTPISGLNDAQPVIKFMNEARYVAQAVGNHEFDWGIEKLKSINERSYFPMLAANIVNKNTGKLVDWAAPTRMIPAAGVKIGLIGIATPDTAGTIMPSNIAELEFRDPAPAVEKYAAQLRNEGAELIIVVSHLPGTMSYETGEVKGELVEVAKKVDVTGIVGGHSHHTVTAVVNGNPIVEAYKHGRELGNLRFFINKASGRVYNAVPMTHPVRKSIIKIKEDPKIAEMVKDYQQELEPIMSEVLIESEEKLVSRDDSISKVGALTTDAMAAEAGADIAFQNPGGLRIDLPQGEINVGHIYELLPFGNTIVTGELTGKQIVSILEQSLTFEKGMLQNSGLRVEYDADQPEYQRVVSVTLADGSPLKMKGKYTVATNNFLAEGGDGFKTFTEAEFTETYIKVRDVLIDHLRQLEEINVQPAKRAIEVDQAAFLKMKKAA